ncbi:Uncharacterised protein [Klebsiella pneumoniae]|nr:Uncharacterised protein [Klebsiella pneumoniae]
MLATSTEIVGIVDMAKLKTALFSIARYIYLIAVTRICQKSVDILLVFLNEPLHASALLVDLPLQQTSLGNEAI